MRSKPLPTSPRLPPGGRRSAAGPLRRGRAGLWASRPGLLGRVLLVLALLLAQGLGRVHGLAHGLPAGGQAAQVAVGPVKALAQTPAAAAGPQALHGHGHPVSSPAHAADHAAGSALCQLLDDLAQAPLGLAVPPGLPAGPAAEARPDFPLPTPPQAEAPAARARDPPLRA